MNNIVDISDNELVMLAVWDDLFRSYLNKRYYYLINVYKYKFMRVIKYYDIDEELIINYGLVGLENAIDFYNQDNNTSFRTFASYCIRNSILNAINCDKTNRLFRKNNEYSLNSQNDNGFEYENLIGDISLDPLNVLENNEDYDLLLKKINKCLSVDENRVFNLLINDCSYSEIMEFLNKTYKQIDNTIQRIKNKIKKYVLNS
jgi:RNA polymerase sporulation-specific sigma factor